MAIEKVRTYLAAYGREGDILEFPVSSATVELAAKALGCPGQRIAKTLSFTGCDGVILVVVAGDAKVDNAKFKATFGLKAHMLPADKVEAAVGHAVGGVCPFAVNEGVTVYLDASLKRFDTVFPACGSDNSAIRLTLPELEELSRCAGWVDVCKAWQDQPVLPTP